MLSIPLARIVSIRSKSQKIDQLFPRRINNSFLYKFKDDKKDDNKFFNSFDSKKITPTLDKISMR